MTTTADLEAADLTADLEAAYLQAIDDARDNTDHVYDGTAADRIGAVAARKAALLQTTWLNAYDAARFEYYRATRGCSSYAARR